MRGADTSKTRILGILKERSQATTCELAQALEISLPAVRKHLQHLELEALVQMSVEKPAGRGRPQQVYRLTATGEDTFPKNYSILCVDVLRHLEVLFGSDALLQVISAREEDVWQHWSPHFEGATPKEGVYILVGLLNELGYQAQVIESEDGLYLEQGNCPSLEVSKRFRQLCASEIHLYERLLGVPVQRESQIAYGATSCRYRIG